MTNAGVNTTVNVDKDPAPILVLGATGKTGRRVAERLRAQGHAVRAGSRQAQPAFDWEDRATWGPALRGVKAVYVSYQPDLAVPGAVETVSAFFEQAVASGAKRLVLLSGRGEAEAEEAEQALMRSGADWTVLRASWFNQNFSENFFLDAILAGEMALPVGDVGEPFIDAEDIAEVAVAALTAPAQNSPHSRRLYELTGPRALRFADALAEIAQATGRSLRYLTVPAQSYRDELAQAQLPPGMIELVMYLFTTVLDGRNTAVAQGVQAALGRPPRDFSDYVARTALTGVWG